MNAASPQSRDFNLTKSLRIPSRRNSADIHENFWLILGPPHGDPGSSENPDG
jgi:hypothetical protein